MSSKFLYFQKNRPPSTAYNTLNQYSSRGRAAIMKLDSRDSINNDNGDGSDEDLNPFMDSEARDLCVLKKLHNESGPFSRDKVCWSLIFTKFSVL